MANYAENTAEFCFKEPVPKEVWEKVYKECDDWLGEFDWYPDYETDEDGPIGRFTANFQTKWSEDTEFMQKLSDKYGITIVGACTELAMSYANSFKITPKK